MNRKITGTYGEKRSYYPIGKFHEGVDLAYGINEPIKAYGSGRVSFVGYDPKGYGNYLKVTSGDGAEHLYAHANNFKKKVNDLVELEEVLGLAGSTGRSTGPHLHFGVYKNGKAVDPMGILNGKKDIVTKVLGTPNNEKGEGYENARNAYIATQIQKPEPPKTAEAQTPTIESLLQKTMTSNLINAMTPREKPQFTSIEDIYSAPKGQKLNKFAEFASTPMALDVINGIVSLVSPTGRYGGSTGAAAQLANEKAVAMGQLHKKIDEENQTGLKISQDVFKELGEDKRKEVEIAFAKDKFTKELEAKNKELTEQIRQFNKNHDLNVARLNVEKNKPSQKFSDISSVRKEFSSLKPVKDYGEIKKQADNVQVVYSKFLKNELSANTADQTIVTTLNKVLDPTSVVRESEFARTAAGQSLIDNMSGIAARIARGGSGLSKKEREDVVKAIGLMHGVAKEELSNTVKSYGELADRYGINKQDIMPTYYNFTSDAPKQNKYKIEVIK